MDGGLILIALLSLAIYIGVIVAATIIASRKGRSAIGWCVLTIIFPIAILFVAIAAPANAYVQQPKQVSGPNGIDTQIIQSVRRNPIVFGLFALFPLVAQVILPTDYVTIVCSFIYVFLLFWLAGIGIVYNKKTYWIISIAIYVINKVLNWIFFAEIPDIMGVLFAHYDYLFFIKALSSEYPLGIIVIIYFVLAIPIYLLQRQLKKHSELTD